MWCLFRCTYELYCRYYGTLNIFRAVFSTVSLTVLSYCMFSYISNCLLFGRIKMDGWMDFFLLLLAFIKLHCFSQTTHTFFHCFSKTETEFAENQPKPNLFWKLNWHGTKLILFIETCGLWLHFSIVSMLFTFSSLHSFSVNVHTRITTTWQMNLEGATVVQSSLLHLLNLINCSCRKLWRYVCCQFWTLLFRKLPGCDGCTKKKVTLYMLMSR